MGIGRVFLDAGRAVADARYTLRRYGAVREAGIQTAVNHHIQRLIGLSGNLYRIFAGRIAEQARPDEVFPKRVKNASLCVPIRTEDGVSIVQFAHTDFKVTEDLAGASILNRLPTVIVFRESDMKFLQSLPLSAKRQLLEDPVGYVLDRAVFIITPTTIFCREELRPQLGAPTFDRHTLRFDDFRSPSFRRHILPHIQPHTPAEIERLIHH